MIVTIDVDKNKTHTEIVGWRIVREKSLEQIKNRANREDGQILITHEGAAGLSALPDIHLCLQITPEWLDIRGNCVRAELPPVQVLYFHHKQ